MVAPGLFARGPGSVPTGLPGWGVALVALGIGSAVGVAVAAGLPGALLLAGLAGPFVALFVLDRPHWAVPLYAVLVYSDLLSVLTNYQGLPPLARVAGGAMLALVLGQRLIIRHTGLVRDTMTWWLLVYGVVLALGLLYARDPGRVLVNLIEFVRNLMTYLIIVNAVTTETRLRRLLGALLAAGVLLATLTIFQSLTGRWDLDFGGLAQSHASGILGDTDAPRPGGTLDDANYYGLSLLILIPLGLYFARQGTGRVVRLAGAGAAAVLAAAVIFTYSRGDAIALLALLGAAVLYARPRPGLVLAGALIGLALLPALPPDYLGRLATVGQAISGDTDTLYNEASLRGRAGALLAGVAIFRDHPLVGVGRENYPLYEADYLAGSPLAQSARGIPPHDLYLEVAAESGVVGLVAMGGLLVTAAGALREAHRRFLAAGDRPQAELAAWLGVALFGYLVGSLFLHGAYLFQFWLQIAIVIALRQLARGAATRGAQAGG